MADEKVDAAISTAPTVAATATEVAKDTQKNKTQKRPPPAELPETYPPKVLQIINFFCICGTGKRGREKNRHV